MLNDFHTTLAATRLIAILRGIPAEVLPMVMDALYDGGIRLAEITYDATGATPDTVTAAMIEKANAQMTGKMHIGAGTVLCEEKVHLTKSAGGSFIISPHTDTALIRRTKELDLYAIPGAMTVSEIVSAHKAGADYIKVFPAATLGPDFLPQVHGPLPHVKLLAVSGVALADVPTYLDAGAAGFGIGGAIVNRKLCLDKAFDRIRENAAAYSQACGRCL